MFLLEPNRNTLPGKERGFPGEAYAKNTLTACTLDSSQHRDSMEDKFPAVLLFDQANFSPAIKK